LAPILVAIVVGVAAGQVLTLWLPEAVKPVAKELGLIFALTLAILWVLRANRMTAGAFKAVVFQPALLNMVYMIAAILIFKGVLEDSGAVAMISQEMVQWSIPLMPITMLLPFMVGMISGITVAFVGATFPILISLVQSMGEAPFLLPYLILAICSGFAGVLLSPLHLCLQMSSEYFRTGLGPVYRLMTVPMAALIVTAVLYFMVLHCSLA
jgi:hypothetical protein